MSGTFLYHGHNIKEIKVIKQELTYHNGIRYSLVEISNAFQDIYKELSKDIEISRQMGFEYLTWQEGLKATFERIIINNLQDIMDIFRDFLARSKIIWTPKGLTLAIIGGRLPDPAVTILLWSIVLDVPLVIRPSIRYQSFVFRLYELLLQRLPDINVAVLLDAQRDDGLLLELIRDSENLVVFGSDETVKEIAGIRVPKPISWFGHKEGLEVVFKDPDEEVIQRIAYDISMYDQSGCLSPHVVAVNANEIDPVDFSERLFAQLKGIQKELPGPILDLDSAARIRLFLNTIKRDSIKVISEGLTPAVVVTERFMQPGVGFRVVQVVGFMDEVDLSQRIEPLKGHVQGMAVYPEVEDIHSFLERVPEFRPGIITSPGYIQRPPLLWTEDNMLMPLALVSLSTICKTEIP